MNVEDLAKHIRQPCLEAVLQAYEDAGIQGLCAGGALGGSYKRAQDS